MGFRALLLTPHSLPHVEMDRSPYTVSTPVTLNLPDTHKHNDLVTIEMKFERQSRATCAWLPTLGH